MILLGIPSKYHTGGLNSLDPAQARQNLETDLGKEYQQKDWKLDVIIIGFDKQKFSE